MSKRLEKFMEAKKVLEDARTALQPVKELASTIIERSYDGSSFKRDVSSAIEEINDALEGMSHQTIGFLDSEIGQEKPSEED